MLSPLILILITLSCTSFNKNRVPAEVEVNNYFDIDLIDQSIKSDLQKFEENKTNKRHKILRALTDPGPYMPSPAEFITNSNDFMIDFDTESLSLFYSTFQASHINEQIEDAREKFDDIDEYELYAKKLSKIRNDFLVQNIKSLKNLFKSYDNKTKKRIVEMLTSNLLGKGEFFNPIGFINFTKLVKLMFKYISITNEEIIREALLAIPSEITGVKYNGLTTRMEFTNKELENHINTIAFSLYENKLQFRKVFFDLPSNKQALFNKNSYSSGDGKTEPFDLILDKFSALMYSRFYFELKSNNLGYIPFKRMAKKALVQTLLVKPKDDIYAWQNPSLNIIKSKGTITYLCANGIFESPNDRIFHTSYKNENGDLTLKQIASEKQSLKNGVLEYWAIEKPVIELLDKGIEKYDVSCGPDIYEFKLTAVKSTEIPLPKPFTTKDDTNIVMTMALVEEIGSTQRELIEKYLSFKKGWKVHSESVIVDTEGKFKELFQITDIYLPVSHSMDVSHFMIGTQKSNYLVLYKEFIGKNNETKRTYLHLLLPHRNNVDFKSVAFSRDELAQLYKQRRANGYPSLFLMNLSCDSEQTLATWTHIYRMSVELEEDNNVANYYDVPYIIGANRGFDTQDFFSIAKIVDFPLGTIKILQTTQDVNKVVSFLENPTQKSVISGLKSFLGFNKSEKEDEVSKDDNLDFKPVYNLADKKFLKYEGFTLKVKNKRTGRTVTY